MPTFQRLLNYLFRLRSRRGPVGLTLGAQALILALGLGLILTDLRHRIALRLQDSILADNIQTAEGLANALDSVADGPAVCGSISCERAQKIVEEVSLPASGFVCLLDANDHIICHPDLKARPQICGTDLHSLEIRSDQGATQLSQSDRSRVLAGRANYLRDGTHFIAAKYIPSMQARLLVQQPESGLLAFSDAAAAGTMIRAAIVAVLCLTLTGAVSFVLIRRHNRALESINRGLEHEVAKRVGESLSARHALIFGLAKLAESRDTDTGEHLERICTYSDILARELQPKFPEITESWVANLRFAVSLHDIGKVGIPDAVLLKPGRLTPAERVVIERHPLIAADTLIAVRKRMGDDELVNLSIQIALSHHEKWDGSGYPYRLKGEDIPLSARIVALADVYDALTSARVYKPAQSHEQAAEIILNSSGSHFDPDIVEAFQKTAAEFDQVRIRYHSILSIAA